MSKKLKDELKIIINNLDNYRIKFSSNTEEICKIYDFDNEETKLIYIEPVFKLNRDIRDMLMNKFHYLSSPEIKLLPPRELIVKSIRLNFSQNANVYRLSINFIDSTVNEFYKWNTGLLYRINAIEMSINTKLKKIFFQIYMNFESLTENEQEPIYNLYISDINDMLSEIAKDYKISYQTFKNPDLTPLCLDFCWRKEPCKFRLKYMIKKFENHIKCIMNETMKKENIFSEETIYYNLCFFTYNYKIIDDWEKCLNKN